MQVTVVMYTWNLFVLCFGVDFLQKAFFFQSKQGLGGGFKHFLFSPLPGEMIQFDELIFFQGVGSTTNNEGLHLGSRHGSRTTWS